jgi:inner membrane protein
MVFIIEPVFWIAFGTPLAAMASRRPARWLLFALLAGAPVFFWLSGYLQWGSLLGLAVLGGLLGWLEEGHGSRDRKALVAGMAAGLGFVVVQAVAAHAAGNVVTAQLAQRDPASRVLDVPLSAFPANPLCWAFVAIERNDATGTYRLSRGALSLAPSITPVAACPAGLGGAPEAPAKAALAWQWEQRASLARLRELQHSNCHADAWLRFARAPSLAGMVATDIRFGPPDSPNFSTLPYVELAAATPCPRHVPGWGYPRADLLGLP